jgi:hypothetical protein
MGTFRQMAGVAADPTVNLELVRNASPIVHAILALMLLVIATVLGVHEPFGMTPYGRHKQDEHVRRVAPTTFPRVATPPATAASGGSTWTYWFAGVVLAGLLLVFLTLHLTGGSFGHD